MVDFGGILKKGKDFANTQKKNFESKPAAKESTAPAPAASTTSPTTTTEGTTGGTATDGTAPAATEGSAPVATTEAEAAESGAAKSKFDFNGFIKKGKEMDKKQLKNNAKDGFSVYKSFKHGGSFTSNATRAYKDVSNNRKKIAEEEKALAAEEKAAADAKAATDAKAAA